jgi:hypothetical protein
MATRQPERGIDSFIVDSVADCFPGGDFHAWRQSKAANWDGGRFWFPMTLLDAYIKEQLDTIISCDTKNMVSDKRFLCIVVRSSAKIAIESYMYDSTGKLLEHRIY